MSAGNNKELGTGELMQVLVFLFMYVTSVQLVINKNQKIMSHSSREALASHIHITSRSYLKTGQ